MLCSDKASMNLPLVNALLFCLAGAFFISFYVIRRIRTRNEERQAIEETYCAGAFKTDL